MTVNPEEKQANRENIIRPRIKAATMTSRKVNASLRSRPSLFRGPIGRFLIPVIVSPTSLILHENPGYQATVELCSEWRFATCSRDNPGDQGSERIKSLNCIAKPGI